MKYILREPERVVFTNGQSIEYDYTANGVKLQKRYLANGQTMTTDYINGFQYENGELLFFGQPEGYVVHTVATNGVETNQYVHNFTDHLGNVRISYTDLDGSGSINLGGEIVKERNYYPFGLQHQGYNNVEFPLGTMFNYGFGGKELQEENGIAWMDFGSRNYDAELGRWFNIDPQAERYAVMSPYGAMGNNPIMYVDPNGEELVTALIVGAAVGAILGTASAMIADVPFQDVWKYTLTGAIAGALSAGVANSVATSAVLIQNGISNTVAGLASGGTGGFVSGSLNAAFNGGEFGDIVGGGFKSGFIGAAIGGATGAIADIKNEINLNRTLNAQGNGEINPNDPIDPSTQILEKFSDDYFPNFRFRKNARLSYDNEYIESLPQKNVRANTNPNLVDGKYDVRFGNRAFASAKTLFRTMGHEYVHVAHLSSGFISDPNFFNNSEYGGYFYEDVVKGINTTQSAKGYLGYRHKLPDHVYSSMAKWRNYSGWGIPTKYPKF